MCTIRLTNLFFLLTVQYLHLFYEGWLQKDNCYNSELFNICLGSNSKKATVQLCYFSKKDFTTRFALLYLGRHFTNKKYVAVFFLSWIYSRGFLWHLWNIPCTLSEWHFTKLCLLSRPRFKQQRVTFLALCINSIGFDDQHVGWQGILELEETVQFWIQFWIKLEFEIISPASAHPRKIENFNLEKIEN